jgi:DNA topoisomerase-1
MSAAQRLYEGVETGRGPGRPDHLHANRLGGAVQPGHGRSGARHRGALRPEYTTPKGRAFKTKTRNAQEAHEAIRPTSFWRDPETLRQAPRQRRGAPVPPDLAARPGQPDGRQGAGDDHGRLWPPDGYELRANATRTTFDGFSRVYTEGHDDVEEEAECRLPALAKGDATTVEAVDRCSTSPSRRRATPRRA